MISFVNFARIASICVGFHLGTLHGNFFHKDFWPNLNFPLEYQIKRVLIMSQGTAKCRNVHFFAFLIPVQIILDLICLFCKLHVGQI